MHRRVLEAWAFRSLVVNNRNISPYMREGFTKKIDEIDVKTGTYIAKSKCQNSQTMKDDIDLHGF